MSFLGGIRGVVTESASRIVSSKKRRACCGGVVLGGWWEAHASWLAYASKHHGTMYERLPRYSSTHNHISIANHSIVVVRLGGCCLAPMPPGRLALMLALELRVVLSSPLSVVICLNSGTSTGDPHQSRSKSYILTIRQ